MQTNAAKTNKGTDSTKNKKPTQRRTQAERRDATRAIILEASSKILRKRGLNGLRTLEVAALAGVSQGAQFHHFPNKKELVLATIEYVNQIALAASLKRAENLNTGDDVIKSILDDAREFFFSDYFFMELAVGFTGEDDSDTQKEVRELILKTRSKVESAWSKRLTQMNMPEQVASDILALTLSMVRGFAIRSLLEEDRNEVERLFNVWREIAYSYLKPYNLTSID